MDRKNRISIMMLLSLISLILAQAQPVENKPATPAELATHPDKYLVIEFFNYNTIESKMVRDQIINSGPASEIIRNRYQVISVEQGKDPEKESQYKITRFPTLIIARTDGTEIDRLVGFQKPSGVAAIFKAAATGHSEIARVREQAAAPGSGIRDRMSLAAALKLRGDTVGAFNEYLWILDHGERAEPKAYAPMYRAVLEQLVFLAREYQPAVEELIKRQEAIENAAAAEKATPQAIARAYAMNEALGQSSRNVPLFLKIPKDSPLKRSLFSGVFLELVRMGKYQEVVDVVDLEDYIGSLYPRIRYEPGHHAHDGHDHRTPSTALKRKLAIHASAACEALIELGQLDKAKRVAGRALEFLGKDKSILLDTRKAIAARNNVNARFFDAWLMEYANLK